MEPEQDIIIVDSRSVAPELFDYFKQFGLNIIHLDGLEALSSQKKLPLALVIDAESLTSLREDLQSIYQKYSCPIIVITSQPSFFDAIGALESGADDVMKKPVLARELHARINAISRRVAIEAKEVQPEKNVLVFDQWRLFPASREVFNQQGERLALTSTEYDFLYELVKQPQEILSRESLSKLHHHSSSSALDRRIDVQISRLRQKIDQGHKKNSLIKTIRNQGYMFTGRVLVIHESELS